MVGGLKEGKIDQIHTGKRAFLEGGKGAFWQVKNSPF
jgi:hypothetical protein